MAEEIRNEQSGQLAAQIKDYVEELQLEMRGSPGPAWPQVRATTGVVIAAVFVFAAYFAVVDTIRKRRRSPSSFDYVHEVKGDN